MSFSLRKGYPETSSKGDVILGELVQYDTSIIFHSGTKLEGDHYVTNGGRVLGVMGLGKDFANRFRPCPMGALTILHLRAMQYRKDIGAKLSNNT